MALRWLSLLALFSGSLGCGNPTSVTQDQFTIQATGREVVLSNTAPQSTFYLVVERETAALIDFAVVYWWRAVQSPTGLRADSVRSTVTKL